MPYPPPEVIAKVAIALTLWILQHLPDPD